MHAEQLTNPRSNVLTFKRSNAPTPGLSMPKASILPTFNFQPKRTDANFVRPNLQPKTFVPQTTNQEHTPITSNYTRKQAFMAHQNGQNIFVPRKSFFKFFLLKNQGFILHRHLASSTHPSSAVDFQSSNVQTCKRSNASILQPSIRIANC
jgi:hypothetical protein